MIETQTRVGMGKNLSAEEALALMSNNYKIVEMEKTHSSAPMDAPIFYHLHYNLVPNALI
jgi:hypothetical protein